MEMNELQEMREQLNILRNKLDNQQIINDRLLRSTMKGKIKSINSNETRVIVLGVFCSLLYPSLHYTIGISWYLVLATILIMAFTIGATIYIHHPLHQTSLMNSDLISVARIMARFKEQYRQWLHIVCPLLITPWLAWFCHETTLALGIQGRERYYFVTFILLCGFVGFLIGYYWHRKTVSMAQDIIAQIDGE